MNRIFPNIPKLSPVSMTQNVRPEYSVRPHHQNRFLDVATGSMPRCITGVSLRHNMQALACGYNALHKDLNFASAQGSLYSSFLSSSMLFAQIVTDNSENMYGEYWFWACCVLGIIVEVAAGAKFYAWRRAKKNEALQPLEEAITPEVEQKFDELGEVLLLDTPKLVPPVRRFVELSRDGNATIIIRDGLFFDERDLPKWKESTINAQPDPAPPENPVLISGEPVTIRDAAPPIRGEGLTDNNGVRVKTDCNGENPFNDGAVVCPRCEYINPDGEKECIECHFPIALIEGKYRLLEQIGRGGMCDIYLAEDVAMRDIALNTVNGDGSNPFVERASRFVVKVLRIDSTSIDDENMATAERMMKKFTTEMTAIRGLKSPHVVQIYNFGTSWLGPYYCMEAISGTTLDDFVKDKGAVISLMGKDLDFSALEERIELIVDIVGQICDALHVCHEYDVVHRDLKSENVMLSEVGRKKHFVTLIDFGIAEILLENNENKKKSPLAVGTPEYMPSEQLHNLPVIQSDIYSLGVIVYFLLTGQFPIPKATSYVQKENVALLYGALKNEKQVPITKHDKRFKPFEVFFRKAFKANPEERYQDVNEFMYALKIAAGEFRASLK